MPHLKSNYRAPLFLKNGHCHTLYPYLFRIVPGVKYERQRFNTPDGDFFDVDWSFSSDKTDSLVILVHGLEGHSRQSYIKGLAKAMNKSGRDVAAFNFRGCSGESNRLLRFYHSGDTEDLRFLIKWVLQNKLYKKIFLVGYSLGANVILKYLGEEGAAVDFRIKRAVTFSCPVNLGACVKVLTRPDNYIYTKSFLLTMKKKLRAKIKRGLLREGQIDLKKAFAAKNLLVWDDLVTAPLAGFKNGQDYYTRCSSINFIPKITIPVLLANAHDDPFLAPECFPLDLAKKLPHFYFEELQQGGHVGFVQFSSSGLYWSEERSLAFLNDI